MGHCFQFTEELGQRGMQLPIHNILSLLFFYVTPSTQSITNNDCSHRPHISWWSQPIP